MDYKYVKAYKKIKLISISGGLLTKDQTMFLRIYEIKSVFTDLELNSAYMFDLDFYYMKVTYAN